VYNIDIDALVQQLLEAARGRKRQQVIKKLRVGALQLLSALLRLNENENGWAAVGLQKSANGDELSLLVAAIHELLVDVGCGGQTRTDCDVHSIVHDRINDFQRFSGHCSAEQCFLKRGAGAGEHMQGDIRESGSVGRETWVIQWHQAARRSCGGSSDQQLMTRHEHAPIIKQSVSLVDDEVLHGGEIQAALFRSRRRVSGTRCELRCKREEINWEGEDCLRRGNENVVTQRVVALRLVRQSGEVRLGEQHAFEPPLPPQQQNFCVNPVSQARGLESR